MSKFAHDCLAGKSILITGALGAIGRVVISELLAHGALVTANDILAEDEARKIAEDLGWPDRAYGYVRADITQSSEAARVIQAIPSFDCRSKLRRVWTQAWPKCP